MNTFETKWMRIQFPEPWRIRTTRDKIIFTPLSCTSKDEFEIICLRKEVGEETDDDLQSFASSHESKCTHQEKVQLGELQGRCLTLQDREKRLFLRDGKFMVIGTIRSEDADFVAQALSIIKEMKLKKG